MKKISGLIAMAAAVIGLTTVSIVHAQPRGGWSDPMEPRYECPNFQTGGCWRAQQGARSGMMRSHRQGMRGYHHGGRGDYRGWYPMNNADGNGYWGGYGPRGNGMMGGGSYLPRDYMISLVTPAEMQKYHTELNSATSLEACQKVDTEHRKLVEERAASMGVEAPKPRIDVCTEMEKDGWFTR